MVKGISRRVVVVRPESGGPFEQAIFLVRDPAFPRGDAVREACRIALLNKRRRRKCPVSCIAVFRTSKPVLPLFPPVFSANSCKKSAVY